MQYKEASTTFVIRQGWAGTSELNLDLETCQKAQGRHGQKENEGLKEGLRAEWGGRE